MNFVFSSYLGILSALLHSVEQLGNAIAPMNQKHCPNFYLVYQMFYFQIVILIFLKTDVCLF